MSELPIRGIQDESLRELMRASLERVENPEHGRSSHSGGASGGKDFGSMFADVVQSVNDLQGQASDSIEALTRGEVRDLHQVMIQMNKAELGFKFLMEVRNKLVEAYGEIARMSV